LVNKFTKIFKPIIFILVCLLIFPAGLLFAGLNTPVDDFSFLPDSSFTETPDTTMQTDTIIVDTLPEKSSQAIDMPVYYIAKDSNINLIQDELLLLYKDAEIKYDDIQLNADFIKVNMKTRDVIAYGMQDSLGNVTGKPIFVQGDETFEADTIRYNFNSKKGIIKNVTSEFDGAYLHGGKTKRHTDGSIHMINGKFTTCDLDHPHFYFKLTKAKVIPDDKVVSGPAFLVVEDIPTPLGIPFGFFPNKKGATSGVIIPEYGEEINRGFFLRNGGYYWAINDYLDLLLTGDIYSKGSWGAGISSNYRVRYKMNGNLSFVYNKNVLGYAGFENYQKNQLYKFKWVHKQDPKAHPSMDFSASVNMSSSAYDKFNSYNANNYLSNTKQSSVNFSKFWPGTPFSFNMSLQHSQNNRDSTVTMTLPNIDFSMSRIYPLKRKTASGKERFYEKIGVSYNMQAMNRVKTREDSIFNLEFQDFDNGIKHSVSISTNMKLLNYITVSPYFNYTERWYAKSLDITYQDSAFNDVDSTFGTPVETNVYGFNRMWDYKTGASLSTKIYGMFDFRTNYLKAVRHVITPSVNMTYYPDFSAERFKYYADYISDIYYDEMTGQYDTISSAFSSITRRLLNRNRQYDTISKTYSRYRDGAYGSAPENGAGALRFNLTNNLEAKVASAKDTTGELKKIKILESLSFNTSYNIMLDSLNWSPVGMTGRTSIGKLNLNFNAQFDPYTFNVDSLGNGRRINELQFNKNGKLARITRADVKASIRFSADGVGGVDKNADQFLYGYPHAYVDFSVPWSLNLSYSFNYTKIYDTPNTTQTFEFSGDVNLTKKWKVSVSSGYDFVNKQLTYTNIEIHRDLHCWEMSLAFVPFGTHQFYSFQINVKSSLLQDLKLQRKQNWNDNY
jgi:hypothetical protein